MVYGILLGFVSVYDLLLLFIVYAFNYDLPCDWVACLLWIWVLCAFLFDCVGLVCVLNVMLCWTLVIALLLRCGLVILGVFVFWLDLL